MLTQSFKCVFPHCFYLVIQQIHLILSKCSCGDIQGQGGGHEAHKGIILEMRGDGHTFWCDSSFKRDKLYSYW